MTLALNNGRAFVDGMLREVSILIEKGRISKISAEPFRALAAEKEIDCKGKIILPGAIDSHVHFRCPGLEYKEDWISGSLAALHGGVTTVMDMPNTRPPTLTATAFGEKLSIAVKNSAVNFDVYMGCDGLNFHEIENAERLRAVKVFFGASTGNMLFNSAEGLKKLFEISREKGFVVVCHAEDENEIRKNKEKYLKGKNGENEIIKPEIHMKIRNGAAEEKAVSALAEIQSQIGNRLHFAHISSEKGLDAIAEAKKSRFGKMITCETAPHYIFLDSAYYKKLGNLIKCNPAIKTPKDRKAIMEALKKGVIDTIASDHAPHTLEEKKMPYSECPSGIPGVETMFPLLIDSALRKKIPLEKVVELVCEKPAWIFRWESKGYIKEGFDADLIIIDPKKTFKIENRKLFTKAGFSPFNNWKLKGSIEKTIIGGTVYG